jgi:hypothetical protein
MYEIPFIIALIYFCILLIYISIENLLQVCEVMMIYHFEYFRLHIFAILYFDVQYVVGYICKAECYYR